MAVGLSTNASIRDSVMKLRTLSALLVAVVTLLLVSARAEQLKTTIHIDATPEQVWGVLSDLEGHAQWDPFIVDMNGELEQGALLDITIQAPKKDKVDFRPIVVSVIPNIELRWIGNVLGMDFLFAGEHYFKLTREKDQTTTLYHGENFSGLLLPLVWEGIRDSTMQGFLSLNTALKARVEAGHLNARSETDVPIEGLI